MAGFAEGEGSKRIATTRSTSSIISNAPALNANIKINAPFNLQIGNELTDTTAIILSYGYDATGILGKIHSVTNSMMSLSTPATSLTEVELICRTAHLLYEQHLSVYVIDRGTLSVNALRHSDFFLGAINLPLNADTSSVISDFASLEEYRAKFREHISQLKNIDSHIINLYMSITDKEPRVGIDEIEDQANSYLDSLSINEEHRENIKSYFKTT